MRHGDLPLGRRGCGHPRGRTGLPARQPDPADRKPGRGRSRQPDAGLRRLLHAGQSRPGQHDRAGRARTGPARGGQAIRRGRAPPDRPGRLQAGIGLLSTYDSERRPVADATATQVANLSEHSATRAPRASPSTRWCWAGRTGLAHRGARSPADQPPDRPSPLRRLRNHLIGRDDRPPRRFVGWRSKNGSANAQSELADTFAALMHGRTGKRWKPNTRIPDTKPRNLDRRAQTYRENMRDTGGNQGPPALADHRTILGGGRCRQRQAWRVHPDVVRILPSDDNELCRAQPDESTRARRFNIPVIQHGMLEPPLAGYPTELLRDPTTPAARYTLWLRGHSARAWIRTAEPRGSSPATLVTRKSRRHRWLTDLGCDP